MFYIWARPVNSHSKYNATDVVMYTDGQVCTPWCRSISILVAQSENAAFQDAACSIANARLNSLQDIIHVSSPNESGTTDACCLHLPRQQYPEHSQYQANCYEVQSEDYTFAGEA